MRWRMTVWKREEDLTSLSLTPNLILLTSRGEKERKRESFPPPLTKNKNFRQGRKRNLIFDQRVFGEWQICREGKANSQQKRNNVDRGKKKPRNHLREKVHTTSISIIFENTQGKEDFFSFPRKTDHWWERRKKKKANCPLNLQISPGRGQVLLLIRQATTAKERRKKSNA